MHYDKHARYIISGRAGENRLICYCTGRIISQIIKFGII